MIYNSLCGLEIHKNYTAVGKKTKRVLGNEIVVHGKRKMSDTTLYDISVLRIQEKYDVSEETIRVYTGKHLRGWEGRFGQKAKKVAAKIAAQVQEGGINHFSILFLHRFHVCLYFSFCNFYCNFTVANELRARDVSCQENEEET